MELFTAMLSGVLGIFSLPLNLFGYSFSFWQVFLFGAVSCILGKFIGRFFLDD